MDKYSSICRLLLNYFNNVVITTEMMRLLYYNLLIKAIEKQGGNQMTEKFIKNMKHEEIVMLSDLVQANEGQIVSKTLAQNEALSITLFAFDKGEEISTHESNGDAMVTVLEGTGKLTVDGKEYLLNAGETLIMPAKKPHAVYAEERFKMVLVVVF